MRHLIAAVALLACVGCGSGDIEDGAGGPGSSGSGPPTTGAGAGSGGGAASGSTGSGGGTPTIGGPGCGFEHAAFCDTFDGPAKVRGRGGELDSTFWSAGRMAGAPSLSRAMPIGMAVIPGCRADVSDHVWPPDDSLICDPTSTIASNHLLVAVAAQNYGQNGYRIRQPFDFAGRTGKIVFDGAVDLMSPEHGWLSLAVSEEPMSMPGYAIMGNDEGSIIPRNAVEVHLSNAPGPQGFILVRNVHVFNDYVDTLYPSSTEMTTRAAGKLNHFEVSISEQGVDVSITPYSEDGTSFAAPAVVHHVDAKIPFSRGYVHVSVHNHATLKYTKPDNGFAEQVDAAVARIDSVGFDGPVVEHWREYEAPDPLVKSYDAELGDPYNTENVAYDVGYALADAADGPKQTLHIEGVDTSKVTSAQLAFSAWLEFRIPEFPAADFTIRARMNGGDWLTHVLTAKEAALFTSKPVVVDPQGKPTGEPDTQGRLALAIDVPVDDIVPGDNTVELVVENVPIGYVPFVCNVDLVMQTE